MMPVRAGLPESVVMRGGIADVPSWAPTPSRRVAAMGVVRRRVVVAWVMVAVVASVVTLIGSDSAMLAALPVLATLACLALWTLPTRQLVLGLLFVALAVFSPSERIVSGGLWKAVAPLQDFLYVYLNRLTGIQMLAIKGIEVIYVVLLMIVVTRLLVGSSVDAKGRWPGVNVLFAFSGLSFVTVILLEMWGIGRGGDFRGSLFQIRELFWLPFLVGLMSYAFRGIHDFVTVARVVTAAACLKVLLGVYFLGHDVWPRHLQLEVMTNHHDTVLFVTVFFMWCAAWTHRPTWRGILPTMLICGWMLTAIILNNRRIAYVSLFASCFVLYVMLQGPLKRHLTRAFVYTMPLVAVYLMLARTHDTGIFKPGSAIVSVTQQKDASSIWRDIENTNLLATLGRGKVVGSGWGHEYVEILKADDISKFMPQYRLVPHNSILWLLGVGGMVGFALLWMPVVIGVYLAARSYRFARTSLERTAAVVVLGILVAYVNQAWGDMGTQGDVQTLLVACALALSGKLARATGAWPSDLRLLAGPRPVRSPARMA
jgi:hypothetical protein